MAPTRMGPARPVGIVEVARLARVSPSTASRALRGGAVSADRRERVLRAAEELRYVPLPAAVRLSSGRGHTVGIVLPTVSRWFFVEVVLGAARTLRAAGYDLLVHDVPEDDGEALPGITRLRGKVDALVLVASAGTDGDLSAWRELGVPLVTVGGREHAPGRVGIDDRAGARTATRHLLDLGHTDVRMIAGAVDAPFGSAASRARLAGFSDELQRAGMSAEAGVVAGHPWGLEGGAAAMTELLDSGTVPTAVFAESDEIAFGALQVLRRRGLKVPEDVSVVGFDDHEMAAAVDLTTVAQPVGEQGVVAAGMVLDLLGTERGGRLAGEVLLPTRLVVRRSTGPPRRVSP
jgi:LacI family repressor for deo operon, udp, cdd, tsx, nupC, and nupG